MRLRVLGSAAGGGFPQWNCGCSNCQRVRRGDRALERRSQDSAALSLDGEAWLLFNASPDILAQVEANPPLHPRAARGSPIAGVALTNGDLDHVLGLLSLRESTPFTLYATRAVRRALWDSNVFFRTLERFEGQVRFVELDLGAPIDLMGPSGKRTGLALEAVAAPGKVPKHLEGRASPSDEDNVAFVVRDEKTGASAVYASAIGAAGAWMDRIDGATVALLDGTFWSSDELVARGLGAARAEDMAHLPIGGAGGTLELFAKMSVGRKIYTHINNTNPILDAASEERRAVEAAGFEVARDGMELSI